MNGYSAAIGAQGCHALGITRGDVVAIAGAGGKTSLLYALADEARADKVLLTTTTHVFPPQERQADALFAHRAPDTLPRGRSFLHGGRNAQGKLEGVAAAALRAAAALADLTLIEADGSRGLPLKGYRGDEPVVPDIVTRTVGVMTLWALDRPLEGSLVLREALFCEQTGARRGEVVTLEHYARMWQAMTRRARGELVLFVNQAETDEARRDALALTELLVTRDAGLRAVIGSVREGRYEVVKEGGA